ncbi:MAG: hypothetical protein K0M58_09470 [Thiobacillus sp.]|nr:hypothetical protein [Thiobacillus sp.]
MRRSITRLDQLTALAMVLIAFCFVAFGPVWGWRAIGVVFAIQGTIVCFVRLFPAVWKEPPPRFHLRGSPAAIAGVIIVLGGAVIVWFARSLAE